MAPAEHALVLDVANLSVLLLGIGLIFHPLFGHLLPAGLTHRYGKIKTEKIEMPELLVALSLIALIWVIVEDKGNPLPPSSENGVEDSHISPSSLILGQFVFVILVMCIALFLAITRGHDLIKFFGLRRQRFLRIAIYSLGVGVICALGGNGLANLVKLVILKDHIGEPQLQTLIVQLHERPDPFFVAALIFTACIVAPIAEETIFRGFLYPVLKRFVQPLVAAFVVSGIFAALHTNAYAAIPLVVFALILTVLYEWTGSLWVPVGVHAVFNSVNIGFTLYS